MSVLVGSNLPRVSFLEFVQAVAVVTAVWMLLLAPAVAAGSAMVRVPGQTRFDLTVEAV